MKKQQNKHRGSDFDDFLKEENIYEEVCAAAAKRAIAAQFAEALQAQNKSIAQLAKEMKTSRATVQRLLDENNDSLSLKTLAKAASVLGKRLHLELTPA